MRAETERERLELDAEASYWAGVHRRLEDRARRACPRAASLLDLVELTRRALEARVSGTDYSHVRARLELLERAWRELSNRLDDEFEVGPALATDIRQVVVFALELDA
jgi:hypothetical protein